MPELRRAAAHKALHAAQVTDSPERTVLPWLVCHCSQISLARETWTVLPSLTAQPPFLLEQLFTGAPPGSFELPKTDRASDFLRAPPPQLCLYLSRIFLHM